MTPESGVEPLSTSVEHLLRELAPQVLGAVARRHGDFTVAEDAVQDALIAAAAQWPAEGVPDNPRGWLYHVAVRRITDHVRSELARRRREDAAAIQMWAEWAFVPRPDEDIDAHEDDTLVLLFMCCHPALTPASAIALTLRAVGGLTTAEIANAFFVPETTMAQRISRAKQSIKVSAIPFNMPTERERSERLSAVLHVLYLIFSEGYTSSSGPLLHRADLSSEAIRLTRIVCRLLPTDGEVRGLLALMLLTDARRAARTGPAGELIPLDEQDRTLWDQRLIAEGIALVSNALSSGSIGSYQLQAAIAAVHDEAPRAEDTDWAQILALYDLLGQRSDNPMVSLNRAIATAMVHGPAVGLELLKALDSDSRMRGHHRLAAVRAHLFEMTGDLQRAVAHYRAAAARTANIPERDYLTTRAAQLAGAVEFRPLALSDLTLLHEWLGRPHVAEWWGPPPSLADVEREYRPAIAGTVPLRCYLALRDGTPIGFIQSYTAVAGHDEGWWLDEHDPGVRGIDQFLVNADDLGRGLGTAMIRAFVAQLFADPAVTRVMTDPAPENRRAIRCYERAGFRAVGEIDTPDGRALLMYCDRWSDVGRHR